MDDRVFNQTVLAIIFVGCLVYYCIEKIKKLPFTGLEGFKSKEVLLYFKETKFLALQNKWLILLLLGLYISQYLFNLLFYLYNVISVGGVRFLFVNGNISQYGGIQSIFSFRDILFYIYELISTPVDFSFIYYGRIINNTLFGIGSVVVIILFKIVINKLEQFVEIENEKDLDFFEKVLKYTFFFGLIIMVVSFVVANLNGNADLIGKFNIFLFGSGIIMNMAVVITFSFLQSVILLSIKEFFSKRSYSVEFKIRESLHKFKNLLKLNFFLVSSY